MFVAAQCDATRFGGGILLRIPGGGGDHVLSSERTGAHLDDGIGVTDPVHQVIGEGHHRGSTTTRDLHLQAGDVLSIQKASQKARIRRGEGARN